MKRFIVTLNSSYSKKVYVEANSELDAHRAALAGKGVQIGQFPDFKEYIGVERMEETDLEISIPANQRFDPFAYPLYVSNETAMNNSTTSKEVSYTMERLPSTGTLCGTIFRKDVGIVHHFTANMTNEVILTTVGKPDVFIVSADLNGKVFNVVWNEVPDTSWLVVSYEFMEKK